MNTEIAALVSAAGTALVQAMTTDGWEAVRDRLAKILGRDNTQARQLVTERLDSSRAALVTNRVAGSVMAARWEGHLETLLEAVPEAGAELRQLVAQIERVATRPASVTQTAFAGRRSRVVQAGHDVDNRRQYHFGGLLALVAVVGVLALLVWGISKAAGWIGGPGSTGLTADSSCADFLQADALARDQAVKRIGLEVGNRYTGSPLALPAIESRCSARPEARLGDFVKDFYPG